jgi:arylsulfatase A-like enzyme
MKKLQQFLVCTGAAFLCFGWLHGAVESAPQPQTLRSSRLAPPNVVLILADDLGYGDLGSYGQQHIRTPHLDRLAAEGMRFTNFYAGSTVCAPSRCVLMTGKHTGHAWVRGNGTPAQATLRPEDKTLAEVFQDAGYATGMFGKWGLGDLDSPGHPNRQGFDEFFGYLNQSHAHNYYPSFLIHNNARFPLANVPLRENAVGAGFAKEKKEYSHDLIAERALTWLGQQRGKPFFLYLPFTLPHANNEAFRELRDGQEVPDYGEYAGKPWPTPDKGQAAMIARLDRDVGRVLAKLKEMGVERNTLVLFSSDNGPHKEGGNNPDFFKASGPLRGIKRALYDGGIRVPFIARWPGKIKPGTVSAHVGYLGDLFALSCELTGQPLPSGLDSLSLLATLQGRVKQQRQHEYLYWEFYEQGSRQAVRFGPWKAIREPMLSGPVQLYDLRVDVGEPQDVAAAHPDIVKRAVAMLEQAHVADPRWRVPVAKGK